LASDWEWRFIPLDGLDLSYVLGGFGWVANAPNNPTGAVFYLDEMYFELTPDAQQARLNEPRFLRSYTTLDLQPNPFDANKDDDIDLVMRNAASTYDNALAVLALLAEGSEDSLRRAKLIGDAFVYASENDRFFDDGRMRSFYMAGDVSLPPGWEPNGRIGTAPVPGYYWEPDQMYYEVGQEAVDTGNNAWAMIALQALYQRTGDQDYLDTALRIGEFIRQFRQDTGTYRGFRGGIDEPEGTPVLRQWASTEHNLDVYAAASVMYDITGDVAWMNDSEHAWEFVESMWFNAGNEFYLDANGSGNWDGADLRHLFGTIGDEAAIGDWEGEGADRIGVHRGHEFYLDASGNGRWDGVAGGDLYHRFGTKHDTPITGDWNSDGKDEIGVHRGNCFYLDASGNGRWDGVAGGDLLYCFGTYDDTPIIGDWNNDGKDEIGVHRGNEFYLDASGNGRWNGVAGGDLYYRFGISHDTSIAGDWNGDGKDEIGVHRGNCFYLDASGNGRWDGVAGGDRLSCFGNYHDTPIIGDWNNDGTDYIGVKRGGAYATGTHDPETRNETPGQLPLDVHTWYVLAKPDSPNLDRVFAAMEWKHRTVHHGFDGYDFNEDKDGVWFEGLGQAAAAYAVAAKHTVAEEHRAELRRAQATPPYGDGKGVSATCHDGLSTGFYLPNGDPLKYFRRLHVGATSWLALAQLEANPYYLDSLFADAAWLENTLLSSLFAEEVVPR
jgi:hypothetical protein